MLLVCGGRQFCDREAVRVALRRAWAAGYRRLVCGGARGADQLAFDVGRELGFSVVVVAAAWAVLGKHAGVHRNTVMLSYRPRCVLAFPGGRGTADMVRQSRRAGVRVLLCAGREVRHA